MAWGFYGRNRELTKIAEILARNRWFFAKMTGRRRIGKTTLIQHAITAAGTRPVYYVQIPDSGPAGVLSAVGDALQSFRVAPEKHPRPRTLAEFARLIESLANAGYVIVIDEFQYVHTWHHSARSFKRVSTGCRQRLTTCREGWWCLAPFIPKW
jgi:AAA+ ATPase superfamily predicted ATPase